MSSRAGVREPAHFSFRRSGTMITRCRSEHVGTKTIIPDRSQPIPNIRYSRRQTTLRACTFTRNWVDKTQNPDAESHVNASQLPLDDSHNDMRKARSTRKARSREETEDRDDASNQEQAHHLSTVPENTQRKGKYSRYDNEEGEYSPLNDNRLADGVSKQRKGKYSPDDNERIEEDLPPDTNRFDDSVSEQRKGRYSCDDNERIDGASPPDDNRLDDSEDEQSKGRYSREDNEREEENLPLDDNQSDHDASENVPSLTSHTSVLSQLRSAQKDTSHVSSAPSIIHSFQSADWVEPQVSLTSNHHGDNVPGSNIAPHSVKVSVGIPAPSIDKTGDASRGQTADQSKLLNSLSNLGMDGRVRLTGVHVTPRKVAFARSGGVRSVSALSPRQQTTQTSRKQRSTAIPVARRAKGRQPKSSIPVKQSQQTKQVDYAKEVKRINAEISRNNAKMANENEELVSLLEDHDRLKGGVSTGLRSRDVSGRKGRGAQANQTGLEKEQKRVKLDTYRTRARIRKLREDTLSLLQELTRLKSAKQAEKRNGEHRKTKGVKQITNFLNKLEELQQSFTASKISQCGSCEVFGSVLDIETGPHKVPKTAKVLSQLKAMENSIRGSLS